MTLQTYLNANKVANTYSILTFVPVLSNAYKASAIASLSL